MRAWWRDQMETFSAPLALCEGNPPVVTKTDLWSFFWCAPEQTAKEAVEMLIWNASFWFVDVLVCRRMFCRRYGLSTIRFDDVLVVDVSVDNSVWRRFGCRRFGLSPFWPFTYKRVHFNTSKPGYIYGHHFANHIFKWISSMTFIFIISLSRNFTSQT